MAGIKQMALQLAKDRALGAVQERVGEATEIGKEKFIEQMIQKAEDNPYSSAVFILAIFVALVKDGVDMIPIPLVDLLVSTPLALLPSFLIFVHLGWKRHIFKGLLRIFFWLFADGLASQFPILEWVTPLTTCMVLWAWYSAHKKYEKQLEAAEKAAQKFRQRGVVPPRVVPA